MSGALVALVGSRSRTTLLYTKHCLAGQLSSIRSFALSVREYHKDTTDDKMAAPPQEIKKNKMFGGFNRRYRHESSSCGCPMTFTVYFPPAAESKKVPVSRKNLICIYQLPMFP